MANKGGRQHEQHTSDFQKELNKPNQSKFTPFRNYDEVWKVGKYKGWKLDETPKSYLKWAVANMNLSDSVKELLRSKLKT